MPESLIAAAMAVATLELQRLDRVLVVVENLQLTAIPVEFEGALVAIKLYRSQPRSAVYPRGSLVPDPPKQVGIYLDRPQERWQVRHRSHHQ